MAKNKIMKTEQEVKAKLPDVFHLLGGPNKTPVGGAFDYLGSGNTKIETQDLLPQINMDVKWAHVCDGNFHVLATWLKGHGWTK